MISKRIKEELREIECEFGITILYACETGSRAWGFESQNSDYDIRFIYIRPIEWYLSLSKGRDVIEKKTNDDLDIAGWDLPKTLQLFSKSNPPLLEWLQSPFVYLERYGFAARLLELTKEFFSPKSCMYHYLNMAQSDYRTYLQDDQIWVKKYFYVLRPLLACLWIEKGLGVVPIVFQHLVDGIIEDDSLKDAINNLIHRKKQGMELDRDPKIPEISDFIESQLPRLSAEGLDSDEMKNKSLLDRFFIEMLIEVYGSQISLT